MNRYAMVASGNPVDAAEVERSDASVVDVVVSWGPAHDRTVLAVKHVAEGASFAVGEGEGCDVLIPGLERFELLRGTTLAAPPSGKISIDGFAKSESAMLLTKGHVFEIAIGLFTIRFNLVAAPKKIAPALGDVGGLRSIGASAVLHGAAFAVFALFMPSMSAAQDESIDRDQLVLMQKYLNTNADQESQRIAGGEGDKSSTDSDSTPGAGAPDPGTLGPENHPPTKNPREYKLKGDATPSEATLQSEKAAAGTFGMIGVLKSSLMNDPNAPAVPWGSVSNGSDDETRAGRIYGTGLDDAFGNGGLGLSGTGEGGGDFGQWIGLNGFGGLGHIGHCEAGRDCGPGLGHGKGIVPGTYDPTKHIHVTPAPPSINGSGHLPPEIIQRIVRLHSGAYRMCYENGLRSNASLSGRVQVRFVIDRSGAVSVAQDAGSDLPDQAVRSCVVRSFASLSFPEPEGGVVTVIYPIVFSPE